MVTTLQNFWLKHRKAIIMGSFLVLGALILPHLAQAVDPAAPAPQSASQVGQGLLDGLSQVMKLLQVIFWPVLLMIGSLMQNDILFGAGMEARSLEVWVNIRNIVNILFVLVLLGIAFYNVMGAGENYHFKTILPKFVIALIAVNFTFIAFKIVLDGVNVVSTAIFALPNTVQEKLAEQAGGAADQGILTVDQINGMCSAIYAADVNTQKQDYDVNVQAALDAAKGGSTICSTDKLPEGTTYGGSYLHPKAVDFFTKVGGNNVALVMALSFQNANLLDKVYGKQDKLNVGTLSINILFSIVLYVIYGTAYVALFVLLLVRLVVLWIMMALSPLIVLPYVLPESVKGMLHEGGDLGKKFIANALAPIPVALVMSIGIVMMNGLKTADFSKGDQFLQTPTLSLDLLTSGVTSLQQLIMAFGTAAFIWIGVFTAMKGTYAEHLTEGIKGAVGGAAKTLGKFAVGSIPLFPTARGTATVGAVGAALKQLPSLPDTKFREQAQVLFPELMQKGGEIGGKMGKSKDKAEFFKNAKETPSSMVGDPAIQKGWAEYYGKGAGKSQHADLAKWLKDAGYKGDVKKFLEEAEAGNVDPNMMRQIYNAAGISTSSASGLPSSPSAASKEQQDKALKNKYADTKKLRESGALTDDIANEDQLKKIQARIKKGEGKKPDSPEAKDAAAALAELDAIDKKVQARETELGQVERSVKFKITENLAGGKPTEQNFQNVEAALKQQVDQIVGSKGATESDADYTKRREAAEKKVLDAAGKNMSKDQQAAFMTAGGTAAGTSLVSRIVPGGASTAAKPPAKPAPAAPKPPAAPAKPPAAPPPKPPKITTEPKPTVAGTASGQESPGRNWVYDAAANAGKGEWINNPNP